MRVGHTIAQKWERQESESERLANRKKSRNKKIIKVMTVFVILAAIITLIVIGITSWVGEQKKSEQEKNILTPSVQIVDEAGVGVTTRMREYVATLENDLKDLGYRVNRAVVPAGKTREVDIFLDGYDYYFKLNIDRASAVSAEDTVRMLKYITANNISPEYVDVRVVGKGYYK